MLKRLTASIALRLRKHLRTNLGFFNINGTTMYLDYLDSIDRLIIKHQSYEQQEVNAFKQLICQHQIKRFIDIGANCGEGIGGWVSGDFGAGDCEVGGFGGDLNQSGTE